MKLCDDLEQSIQQNQKHTQKLLQVTLKEEFEPKHEEENSLAKIHARLSEAV